MFTHYKNYNVFDAIADYNIWWVANIDYSFFEKDTYGRSVLSSALSYGYYDMSMIILNKMYRYLDKKDLLIILNGVDENGFTALDVAVRRNFKHVVHKLLQMGVNPNTVDNPLYVSSKHGFIEISLDLLLNGANPCSACIYEAVDNGHYNIVKELLIRGVQYKEDELRCKPVIIQKWESVPRTLKYYIIYYLKFRNVFITNKLLLRYNDFDKETYVL